ncbi:hypothetical protein SEA_PAVLO_37 [Microbacterium phage Pavlo]|nr:hypothetical protein LUPINE_37 [Microbacterium phage Lupine]UVG34094.1 hypothetical protein SEA_PAVLO_37 [Microbacterium phage Pavlo]
MENMAFDKRGIAPPNPETPTGNFRLLAGDSDWMPYSPQQPGYGLYQVWSDSEIQAFLILSGGNVARAISYAYTQIGASYAASGATIKTDDLSYSAKDSVGNWQGLARYWSDMADKEDQRAANDMFIMVDTGREQPWMRPEGSPQRYPDVFPCPSQPGNDGLDGGTP